MRSLTKTLSERVAKALSVRPGQGGGLTKAAVRALPVCKHGALVNTLDEVMLIGLIFPSKYLKYLD